MIAAKNAKVAKVDWKTVKLGEICELVIDHRGKTPKKLGGDWAEEGYRALSAKSVKTRQIVNEESIHLVSQEMYSRWMKEEIQRGDILVTSEAPYGEVFYWNSDEKIVLSQRLFGLRIKQGFDSAFVAHYMTSATFRKEMDARATGTTVFGLRQPELLDCPLPLPPLPTQRKIAAVLGALDDKIENNRKICANLEAQAQALFKSWFVDFEPFGGKMPDGWKVEPLQECINFQEGPGIRNWQYVEKDGTKFINIRCIVDHDIKIATANMISNEEANGKYAHFMLHEYDIVMSCSGTLGRFAIVRKCHLPLCLNTSVIRFYPKGSFEHFSWLYGYLGSDDFLLQQEALANGSVQANFGPTHLKGMKVRMPSDDALARYHSIVFPLIKKELSLLDESRALAELRDALLPKLMSGELDVDDVEV